jgi:hypothetical protein
MRRLALLVLASTLFTAVAPHVARAETTATSSIAQVKVLEPGDKNFRLFHGAIWLEYDKANYNYRWGGLECKGRELSDSSIQLLFASFKSEYSVTLEYVVSEHESKQYRCITGFTVAKS